MPKAEGESWLLQQLHQSTHIWRVLKQFQNPSYHATLIIASPIPTQIFQEEVPKRIRSFCSATCRPIASFGLMRNRAIFGINYFVRLRRMILSPHLSIISKYVDLVPIKLRSWDMMGRTSNFALGLLTNMWRCSNSCARSSLIWPSQLPGRVSIEPDPLLEK